MSHGKPTAKTEASKPLQIPGGEVARVVVIDTTSNISFPNSLVVTPTIRGNEHVTLPSYSFLITSSTGRHILFDLGVRKDHQSLPPKVLEAIKKSGASISVKHDVASILAASAADLPRPHQIEAVVWSHHHWDHTGDMRLFPATTALIVGPRFKGTFLPGYPTDSQSELNEMDWEGREFREVLSDGSKLRIGDFEAEDYFGDGSFYLLHTPGHTIGHLCGLARIGNDADESFIFMGADACHHPGEFRPSAQLPLPSACTLTSSTKWARSPCPGSTLLRMHRTGSAVEPFYLPRVGANNDHDAALETIRRIMHFDANPRIVVILSHDAGLRDCFAPPLAHFAAASVERFDERTRWLFLNDFVEAIDQLV